MCDCKDNIVKKGLFIFLLGICFIFLLSTLLYLNYYNMGLPICFQGKTLLNQDEESGFSSDQFVLYENDYGNNDDPDYLKFVRNQWIISPSTKPRTLKEIKGNGDYSQVWQSPMIDKLLSEKRNGFYVECGAANGEFISNTLFFELNRNWSGLLVEPNFAFFQDLLRTNRKAYAANVCLNTKNVSKKQKFSEYSWWGGIPTNLEEVNKEVQIVTVQCFPLEVLLRALQVDHVDYFSLDVEGAELEIIKTIPFGKITIEIIGLEYRVTNGGGTQATKNLDKTLKKLASLRKFFNETGIYKEVGILPIEGRDKKTIDEMGLDVFFQKI